MESSNYRNKKEDNLAYRTYLEDFCEDKKIFKYKNKLKDETSRDILEFISDKVNNILCFINYLTDKCDIYDMSYFKEKILNLEDVNEDVLDDIDEDMNDEVVRRSLRFNMDNKIIKKFKTNDEKYIFKH